MDRDGFIVAVIHEGTVVGVFRLSEVVEGCGYEWVADDPIDYLFDTHAEAMESAAKLGIPVLDMRMSWIDQQLDCTA